VLLQEAVENLVLSPDGIYVDATFGRGSHSRAILNKLSAAGRLIAFDQDPQAVAYANQHFHDQRFTILHHSFTQLQLCLTKFNLLEKVQGILFDLGVSSPQLDDAARGFSFTRDGQLDMRMDTTRGIDAATWLASIDEQTLATVLWEYGEEKFSRRIARAIVTMREEAPIQTTLQLAEIIKRAMPKKEKYMFDKHPATRSFQAIRIAVNQELTALQQGLAQSLTALAVGGRLAVISFHSLEDRIVKQFIRQHEQGEPLPRGLPIKGTTFKAKLKSIGKPIKPNSQEVNNNPRSRSAILRITEKIS
jgi:16S rRNA (cytosine1402-N4)-methyltransferase